MSKLNGVLIVLMLLIVGVVLTASAQTSMPEALLVTPSADVTEPIPVVDTGINWNALIAQAVTFIIPTLLGLGVLIRQLSKAAIDQKQLTIETAKQGNANIETLRLIAANADGNARDANQKAEATAKALAVIENDNKHLQTTINAQLMRLEFLEDQARNNVTTNLEAINAAVAKITASYEATISELRKQIEDLQTEVKHLSEQLGARKTRAVAKPKTTE